MFTSEGVRALKTILIDTLTIDDMHILDNKLKKEDKVALLLEYTDRKLFSEFVKSSIPNFYGIARKMICSMMKMHNHRTYHLNLSCDHIILNSNLNTMKIISLASSSSFYAKQSYDPKLSERDLCYVFLK